MPAIETIKTEGLLYVHDSEPGYGRKKHGRGFTYLDEKGERLCDEKHISRIKKLKIPPAWQEVWICKQSNGYLQATGNDSKMRKQYLYHEMWQEYSRQENFAALLQFGRLLPKIRKTIDSNLRKRGWPREKVLSLVLKMMDENYLRVGNQVYTKQNQSYGATTLRRKHVKMENGKLLLSYKGKSGKDRRIEIEDPQLKRLIKASSELPGYELFRYLDEEGKSHRIDSADINDFLHQITGGQFTSKTFRTWSGTALCVYERQKIEASDLADKSKKLSTTIVKRVAKHLGNTPAVAQKYYIHPDILTRVSNENFSEGFARRAFTNEEKEMLDTHELMVLHLIENHQNQ